MCAVVVVGCSDSCRGGPGGLTACWLIRGASHQRHDEKTNNSAAQHAQTHTNTPRLIEEKQCEGKVKES